MSRVCGGWERLDWCWGGYRGGGAGGGVGGQSFFSGRGLGRGDKGGGKGGTDEEEGESCECEGEEVGWGEHLVGMN